MPKKAITQLFLERIKPPKNGRIEYWDTGEPGLHLRITEQGKMTWAVMYRVNGKQVRETLGTLANIPKVSKARDLAAESKAKASGGVNPVEQRRTEAIRAAANTVAGAVGRYLHWLEHDQELRPATLKGYRQIFNHDVLPVWGDRSVALITDADVLVLLNKKRRTRERKRQGVTGGAGVQANRVLARLQTFFKWCMAREQKLITVDPTAGITPPVKETARSRVLTDDEIKAFWTATGALDAKRRGGIPCGALFRLLLLTAQRKGEVAGMRCAEIDSAQQWTIPEVRVKNGKEHIVHLSDFAMEVLDALSKDRDLIFSGISGGRTTSPNFAWAKSCVDAEMLEALPTMKPWVLHDLRRTATTVMAKLKIAPHIAEKVLNHTGGKISGVAAIYNQFDYLDERKDALETLGRYIENLVEPGGAGNVVPLRGATTES
jgi:integrase